MVEGKKLACMPALPKLPKKSRKTMTIPTLEQARTILSVSCLSWRVCFSLALWAGLRSGEIRAIRWREVNLDKGSLVIRRSRSKGETSTPKSGHDREIPIAAQLRKVLEEAGPRGPNDLVAVTAEGEPWGDSGILQAFRKAQRKVASQASHATG